jgi:hypothetical protein
MDGMNVSGVGGDSQNSNSTSQSSSESNGFDSDSSSQINGVEQGSGNPGGANQTGNGGDSLQQGNDYQARKDQAMEEFNKLMEQFGIKPPGEEAKAAGEQADPASQGSGGGKPAGAEGTGGGQPAEGASGGGETPSLDDIIKMLAEKFGISEADLKQMLESAGSEKDAGSGQDTATAAPSKSDAMFA